MSNILFIAYGFPPFEFSENIVNGKLVLAFQKRGHTVKVISKRYEGPSYNSEWRFPWLSLKPITYCISYPKGSMFKKLFEVFRNTLHFRYLQEGIRWAEYAYLKAKELLQQEEFDVLITRSPSDIAHLVGLRLKRELNIRWIANFNDPSTGVWPDPYERNIKVWKKIIAKRFVQEILKKADNISFPSILLAEHFKEHFSLKDRCISIIPHIMLNETFEGVKTIDQNCLHMVHSGNLSQERDPKNLLIALKKFNTFNEEKVCLDILGVIAPVWLNVIAAAGIEQYVKAVKPMPYFEAMRKMAEYDVLLIIEAQLEKGIFLPSKIADYSQLKKPILAISPKIGEVSDILEKYGGGLVANNRSVDEIYDKLVFLSCGKQNGELAKLAKKNMLDNYLSEKRVIDTYEMIFNTLGTSVDSRRHF